MFTDSPKVGRGRGTRVYGLRTKYSERECLSGKGSVDKFNPDRKYTN